MKFRCSHCDEVFEVTDSETGPEVICTCCGEQVSTQGETMSLDSDAVDTALYQGAPRGARVPALTPGQLLRGYRVIRELARGGMGIVYLAEQEALGRRVALKVLSPEFARDPDFVRRFEREARALANLNHPNIVSIIDRGHEGDVYFFVMEYVDGVSLREVLTERRLTPAEALKFVPEICAALDYAHGLGIVHRDIKPENILIDTQGRVKITDFGLSKVCRGELGEDRITRTHTVMGTLDYMAPEQRERSREVDHRADIYSLGVVFYEMLTGELPIGKFAMPSKKNRAVTIELDKVILKVLEKDPGQRYQNASAVATDVERASRARGCPIGGSANWGESGITDDLKSFYPWAKQRIRERKLQGLFGVIVAFAVLGLFGMGWVMFVIPWLILAFIIKLFSVDKDGSKRRGGRDSSAIEEEEDDDEDEDERSSYAEARSPRAGAGARAAPGAEPTAPIEDEEVYETPEGLHVHVDALRRRLHGSTRAERRFAHRQERIERAHAKVERLRARLTEIRTGAGERLTGARDRLAKKIEKAEEQLAEKKHKLQLKIRAARGGSVAAAANECREAEAAADCCPPEGDERGAPVRAAYSDAPRHEAPAPRRSVLAWLLGTVLAFVLFVIMASAAMGAAAFAALPPLRDLAHAGVINLWSSPDDMLWVSAGVLLGAVLGPFCIALMVLVPVKALRRWGGAQRSTLVRWTYVFAFGYAVLAGGLAVHLALDPGDRHEHSLLDWSLREFRLREGREPVRAQARAQLVDMMLLRAGDPAHGPDWNLIGVADGAAWKAERVLREAREFAWTDLRPYLEARDLPAQVRRRAFEVIPSFAVNAAARADARALLVTTLSDRTRTDARERQAAFRALLGLSQARDLTLAEQVEAMEVCVAFLRDDDPAVRGDAFNELRGRWAPELFDHRAWDRNVAGLFDLGPAGHRSLDALKRWERDAYDRALAAWDLWLLSYRDLRAFSGAVLDRKEGDAVLAVAILETRAEKSDGHDLELLDGLLAALESPHEEVRKRALRALREYTEESHGYDPRLEPSRQGHALDRWQRWHRRVVNGYTGGSEEREGTSTATGTYAPERYATGWDTSK